jgi:hypothetical protein
MTASRPPNNAEVMKALIGRLDQCRLDQCGLAALPQVADGSFG